VKVKVVTRPNAMMAEARILTVRRGSLVVSEVPITITVYVMHIFALSKTLQELGYC